jgi:hypothetical protein
MQNEIKTAIDASKKKVSVYEDAVKWSEPCTLRRVNWFANDETGVMYVREWDEKVGEWVDERPVERLSHVAQLLNRLQVMPNAK